DARLMAQECLPLSNPIDADDAAEPAGPSCLYAGEGVFEDRRAFVRHADHARSLQVGVRRRFAPEVARLAEVTVDLGVEHSLQPGGVQDLVAMFARGDDRRLHAGSASGTNETHGALVRHDAVAMDEAQKDAVLARSKVFDLAVVEVQVPRLQERANSILTRFA